MKVLTLSGREVYVNPLKYKVNWDKPCRSKIQFIVKKFLEPYIYHHLVVEEWTVPKTRLSLDLIDLTSKIAYEVNGKQHITYIPGFFHKRGRCQYLGQIKRDILKYRWCEINNIKLVEINEDEVPFLTKEFFKKKYDVDL